MAGGLEGAALAVRMGKMPYFDGHSSFATSSAISSTVSTPSGKGMPAFTELRVQGGHGRHVQVQIPSRASTWRQLAGGYAFLDNLAVADHQDAVGLNGLFHIMGNPRRRNALSLVQATDGFQHIPPAKGVQHGRGFVGDQDLRLHWPAPRQWPPAAFCPPESRRGAEAANSVMCTASRAASMRADHLIGGYTDILQAKGHIFPYHGGYQLIVRGSGRSCPRAGARPRPCPPPGYPAHRPAGAPPWEYTGR